MLKVALNTETDELYTPSSTKEGWVSVRLEGSSIEYNGNIPNRVTRSVIMRGEESIIKELYTHVGQPVEGKIIREESFEPFWNNQKPKINPRTKETILKEGRPVFMQNVYTRDMNAVDYKFINNSVKVQSTQDALEAQAI